MSLFALLLYDDIEVYTMVLKFIQILFAGKRPRDLLNPKAVKYMQSVFSIKDAISKKESREISALFGVTVTQVSRDFPFHNLHLFLYG